MTRAKNRRLFIALAALLAAVLLYGGAPAGQAQTLAAAKPGLQAHVSKAVSFGLSKPLRDTKAQAGASGQKEIVKGALPTARDAAGAKSNVASKDGALQSAAPAAVQAMPTPALSFEGINNADNATVDGGQYLPPDTNGDVGPNNYVQSVNVLFQVFDKAGNELTPPMTQSSLYAGLNTPCAAEDDGDPIALYDPLADRWLISQFALPDYPDPPYYQCIAISQTGDPTGAYYLYTFEMPESGFNDYPHFGVWPDAYYMTDNQFAGGEPDGAAQNSKNAAPQAVNDFAGAGAFAFDRFKMLVGDPSASYVYFDLGEIDPSLAGGLPADVDGIKAPPAGEPNYFSYFTANEYGQAADGLQIYSFHADFANPGASTFTALPFIPVAPFDPRVPTDSSSNPTNPIEQPSPATQASYLDAIQDRLMHRVAYRNFGGYESLVLNHTVNVSGVDPVSPETHQSGVRYYELRRNLSGGAFTVAEQASYAPDSANRWMGSAAMDNKGNLAVGYSVSSSVIFPSIRYAGRLATDPANGLYQGEQTLIPGGGAQTEDDPNSGAGRWGDYSAMSVDPVNDCSFWYTQEYYPATSNSDWHTRIGSFKFPSCTAPAQGVLQGTITFCNIGDAIADARITIANAYFRETLDNGAFSLKLPPGTYTVNIDLPGYATVTRSVTITNGGTSTLNACIPPKSQIVASESSITAESCADNAIDPGETVTVSLCLSNTGSLTTTNLTASLLATGGVTNPSAAQNYGAIPINGDVCMSFSFTASSALPCGGALTATLHLQDGPTDLGNVSFPFRVGAPVTPLNETFEEVVTPTLPAGWTAALLQGAANDQPWHTVNVSNISLQKAAFAADADHVTDNVLVSPPITITSGAAQLSFQNSYDLEDGYDGAALEISIGGAAYTDVITAGGSFVSGGYTDTIFAAAGNPLAGRSAWSGDSGGFITTTLNLPPAAVGHSVRLRWRLGSDTSIAEVGQYIDNVTVIDGYSCCGQSGGATLTPTATSTRTATNSPTATRTPTGTATSSPTNTQTPTGTATQTATNSPTVTLTPTGTATNTLTPAATSTPCTIEFSDAPTTNPFYGFIRSLACKGIISGYSDNTFRPFNNVTRGQAAKIVTLAAGFNDDIAPTQQSFKDVAPGSAFWLFVERAKLHGTISGYNDPTTCNGAANIPCFRPELNMTRGQMAKVVANAKGLNNPIPAGQQTFQDVTATNPFYNEIERVAGQGIISGYNCGAAPAGDCVAPDNKPYFLWGNQVTRGQTAKIVGGAFFPNGE